MIQLTYYDDGKGNFQSHEVSVETPHCVWNDDLNDLIEYELTNIIGYGETEEEALNNFVNKLNYALDEWNAFAKMLNEQICMSDREEYIKLKQTFEDIVTLVNNNHMDTIPGLYMLVRGAKEALRVANLYEKWRLNVRADQLINPCQIEYGIGIGIYSDIPNGPKIEPTELLKISFPTGAYIFDEDYDTELFKEFYKELHDVTPAYEDELNHALYYTADNGSEAYEHYLQTYKKYNEMSKDRSKQRRIKELEKELKMLKK